MTTDNETKRNTIGDRIKQGRIKNGWSLTKLSFFTGIAKSHLWAIEKDKTDFSANILYKLSNIIGWSMDYLYKGVAPDKVIIPPKQEDSLETHKRLQREKIQETYTKWIDEITAIIKEHEELLNISFGYEKPEKVKALIDHYKRETVLAIGNLKMLREKTVSYLRAVAFALEAEFSGATHAERNARLRGAIAVIERVTADLENESLTFMSTFTCFNRDLYNSNLETRDLMKRIHELEKDNAELKARNAIG